MTSRRHAGRGAGGPIAESLTAAGRRLRKAATSTRGIAGEPQEVIDTAVMYLAWLKSV
jgi:hypothetical protein